MQNVPMTLSPQMVRELSAKAHMDERTVRKSYRAPNEVREGTRERLRKAAKALRLQPPPQPSTSERAL